MMTAYLIIFIAGTFSLVVGLSLSLWTIFREINWLKAVLVPWMNNISKAVNPDKK